MELSKYIDHTLLKPDASIGDIMRLCKEATENNFKSVCVNPCNIEICRNELKNSDVLVCTVIGFPLGAMTCDSKVFEAKNAIEKGADEIDMVLNIGRLKDKDLDYCMNEIKDVKEAIGNHVLKVIIETCLLNDEQIADACNCILKAKADFVKTSTGFSISGATFEVVSLIKSLVDDKCLIKAAGGIKTHDDLLKMINLGADRIGTSSSLKII